MNNQFSLGVLWQRGDDFIVYPTSTMTSWYVIASKRYRQSPSHWASLLEKEGGPTKRRDPPPQAITSETVCLSRLIVMLHVTEFLTSSTVQVSLTCSQRGTQALQSSFPTPPPPPPVEGGSLHLSSLGRSHLGIFDRRRRLFSVCYFFIFSRGDLRLKLEKTLWCPFLKK